MLKWPLTSFIPDLTILTILASRLLKNIIKIDKIISESNENFCFVCFFKKADLIAITKSSLLTFIFPNIQ